MSQVLALPTLARQTPSVDAAIGSRMKQLREAKKLSQLDLAAAVGVSVRTLGTWERTGNIPLEQLPKLADALGQDLRDAVIKAAHPPTEINYRGWRFVFQPAPGATPEQIRKAEAAVLDTALARLRELGLDDGE